MKKKTKKNQRTYEEIIKDVYTATNPKICRKLHKELRAYGDGLPFMSRYPNFALYGSIANLAIAFLALIVTAIITALR